jgi:hypothetical protein
MIEFGNPPVLSFDKNNNLLDVYIKKPDNNRTILELIGEQLKDVKKAHICLSGGVDSQFWVRICDHFNIPMRATTYLTFWEGSPINTDDFVCAQLTAQKYNIQWDVIDIHLDQFLGTPALLETAKKYNVASQQLAVHMHYLEKVVNQDEVFFMGGDCVYLGKTNTSDLNLIADYSSRLLDIYAYSFFFKEHNAKYFKDVFLLSPEVHYLFLKESVTVADLHNVYIDRTNESVSATMHPGTHVVKHLIWENIIPGEIPQLVKTTGFEKLKKYFAVTSGEYNKFDTKYRSFLQQVTFKQRFKPNKILAKTHGHKDLLELSEEFDKVTRKDECQPVTIFNFDF